jgi:hypothetical protein
MEASPLPITIKAPVAAILPEAVVEAIPLPTSIAHAPAASPNHEAGAVTALVVVFLASLFRFQKFLARQHPHLRITVVVLLVSVVTVPAELAAENSALEVPV